MIFVFHYSLKFILIYSNPFLERLCTSYSLFAAHAGPFFPLFCVPGDWPLQDASPWHPIWWISVWTQPMGETGRLAGRKKEREVGIFLPSYIGARCLILTRSHNSGCHLFQGPCFYCCPLAPGEVMASQCCNNSLCWFLNLPTAQCLAPSLNALLEWSGMNSVSCWDPDIDSLYQPKMN